MTLETLYEKIELPKSVIEKIVLFNDVKIPEELLKGLTKINTAENAYQRLSSYCKAENHGLDLLCYMLQASLKTYNNYLNKSISDKIYFDTINCFSRFVQEHKASFGYYGFDRGWWAYRQLSMVLFRIEAFEYEFRDNFTLNNKTGYISIHIPTGADISITSFKQSFNLYQTFLNHYYPEKLSYPYMLSSWLLSPALKNLLESSSKILNLQDYFDIVEINENSTDFLQWVYGRIDSNYADLPEHTSLQKKMKCFLLQGGKVGSARGIFKVFN